MNIHICFILLGVVSVVASRYAVTFEALAELSKDLTQLHELMKSDEYSQSDSWKELETKGTGALGSFKSSIIQNNKKPSADVPRSVSSLRRLRDYNRFCQDLGRKGECTRNPEYMKVKCALTCKAPVYAAGYEKLPENKHCSEGTFISNIDQCATAAAYLKITATPRAITNGGAPKGCFQMHAQILFNKHATGSMRAVLAHIPICIKKMSDKYVQAGLNELCHNDALIANARACKEAAKELDLGAVVAKTSSWKRVPKGCYWLEQISKIYFNAHSSGSGQSNRRANPLCMRPVHCEWNDWTIGECDLPCGGGIQTNTRTKKVEKEFGGDACKGGDTIKESCNVQECPINCEWNAWKFGECSVTCGGGTRVNKRTKKVEEAYGGACTGKATKMENCNGQECPPIHCEWGYWEFGDCSEPCGRGIRINSRRKEVVEANGGTCTGQPTEERVCMVKECPIDCEWGPWIAVYGEECTAQCGEGRVSSYRDEVVSAKHGGHECIGPSTSEEPCNIHECPLSTRCCETENDRCNTYVQVYNLYRYCDSDWFTGCDGTYRCRLSCGLCK